MSRRALPPRATRGSKPVVRSVQEEQRDDALYARMFGQDLDDDEDFILRQARENQRKERTLRNLSKYSYARGFTYCFDLDDFPRVEGHPSYAADLQNVFGSTYKQEQLLYRETALGELMNRVYFGLPYTENEPRRGEGKTKNACHYFLFQNEDRKYQLDRAIATFKALQRRVEKGKTSNYKGYALIKKDPELDELMRSQSKPEVKVEALRKKIQALEQRKSSNVIGWYHDDELFLQHSRNQLLHDQTERLKKELTLSKVSLVYYEIEAKHREVIQEGGTDVSVFLRQALTFYNSDRLAVTEELFSKLIQRHSRRILQLVDGQPGLIFPQRIFYFGTPVLRGALDSILASKVQQQSQATYYLAKFAWRRLFKAELPVNNIQKQRTEDTVALGRRLVEEAKHFYKQFIPEASSPPAIDSFFNWQQIQTQGIRSGILRQGQGVQISGKEVMVLCVYDWLLKAYSLLLPFAERHPELPQLIASEQFQKFSHGFTEAINSPLVATLRNSLELMAQVVARTEPIMAELGSLYFQWDEASGVGVLWRSKPDEEVWETEREEDEEEGEGEEEEVDSIPSKKLKENDA